MIKNIFALVSLLISLCVSAQPMVVTCTLESEYMRDRVRDGLLSGVVCSDCRVAIRVIEDGRTLYLDGFHGHTPRYWFKRDDKLDINGFGGRATWRINSEEISASEEKFEYGKKDGYASLTISRLTGNFYSISVSKNPIGNGNIESTTTGVCRAVKAAF